LKIHSRVGERPGSDGVMEVGASQSMEALVEVYESDINRISIGQSVTLISENGGFKGTLEGRVKRITPQVRQRKVLSTDPTGDADARVIEVDVVLTPESAKRVTQLSGLKVIARFKTP
ncbi:MAG: HlyD family efflux transporter periplasmic adaptor subunit, partial [Synechococcales cyanobacterium H12SWP_bin.12]|nr:HlyD family efflux transporter periplasmic adaptor subunit [Synechococcales cyanobacterium H12SWP_bin.12]